MSKLTASEVRTVARDLIMLVAKIEGHDPDEPQKEFDHLTAELRRFRAICSQAAVRVEGLLDEMDSCDLDSMVEYIRHSALSFNDLNEILTDDNKPIKELIEDLKV